MFFGLIRWTLEYHLLYRQADLISFGGSALDRFGRDYSRSSCLVAQAKRWTRLVVNGKKCRQQCARVVRLLGPIRQGSLRVGNVVLGKDEVRLLVFAMARKFAGNRYEFVLPV